MRRIRVRVGGGRAYDIFVGFRTLGRAGRQIKRAGLRGRAVLITSPTIGRLYQRAVAGSLRAAGYHDIAVCRVPDGERHKTFAWYHRVLGMILQRAKLGGDQKDVFVVNLGGGVIGDLGGFVAASFRRGTAYVQIPTTLLAFVDCGIGGKVGVNLDGVKNAVGAFHQPRLVWADLSLLKTLPRREIRSALAEVVKYGVIESASFFDFIESNVGRIFSLDGAVLERVALTSYKIKAGIVGQDEFDTRGIRARLNYGHTIGHAVESASEFAFRHGEAVAFGMACANDIAVKMRLLNKGVSARIEKLLINIGLPVRIKRRSMADIMRYFWRDKKFAGGKNKFILPAGLGRTVIRENIPLRLITETIEGRFYSA